MIAAGHDAGCYRVAHLHQPDGWLSPGYLEIDPIGTIATVAAEAPPGWAGRTVRHLDGYVVPGMANLHSHAHQRGLAGRAEGIAGSAGRDDFWSWRTRMYAFVDRLDPDALQAIAAMAYQEMLLAGFTTVGEFHYLHHDRDGRPYANPAECSERILAAAGEVGIGLTLLPALYTAGGIGVPPATSQRRFVHDNAEAFLDLIARLLPFEREPLHRIGIAPHSLRAVGAEDLVRLLTAMSTLAPEAPVHIHVAEQTGEVEECRKKLGARPIEWLLAHAPVGPHWTLIHATHTVPAERRGIASSGAVVGLCPITEANLGDGLFPLLDYHRDGGRWGIGTDSNIAIDLAGELRLLEYGQRLTHQRRAILATPDDETTASPGRRLFDLALAGGARATGQSIGVIRPGLRADLVELDPASPPLIGHDRQTAIDGWIFAGGTVSTVFVAGTRLVIDGHHLAETAIRDRFRTAMRAVG